MTLIPVNTKNLTNRIVKRGQKSNPAAAGKGDGKKSGRNRTTRKTQNSIII